PVLLVLEDVHWADRSTRDLLTFLSRVLHREKVAVVVTYRTDDLPRRHPLRPVVAELLRLPGVTAIELAPLGYADMADHLSALAESPLDAATLHRIVTRAEGNPYYGEELLAAGNCRGERPGSVLPTGLAPPLLPRLGPGSGTARDAPPRAGAPRCPAPGSSRSPTPLSRCCGPARWRAGTPRRTSSAARPGCPRTSSRRGCGSRWPISCSSRTAPMGTPSGTR